MVFRSYHFFFFSIGFLRSCHWNIWATSVWVWVSAIDLWGLSVHTPALSSRFSSMNIRLHCNSKSSGLCAPQSVGLPHISVRPLFPTGEAFGQVWLLDPIGSSRVRAVSGDHMKSCYTPYPPNLSLLPNQLPTGSSSGGCSISIYTAPHIPSIRSCDGSSDFSFCVIYLCIWRMRVPPNNTHTSPNGLP